MAIVLALAAAWLGGVTVAPDRHAAPWLVVRHDYKEFCAGTTLTWNLSAGTLTTSRGSCPPHRAPPTIEMWPIRRPELSELRAAADDALRSGVADDTCLARGGSYFQVMSGPRDFAVKRGKREIRSPRLPWCLNAAGRRLTQAMEEALAPSAAETATLTQELIRHLDLTSFPNSVGPRRMAGKKSFADYGFTDVKATPAGAELYRADRGWMMRFRVLREGDSRIWICFSDRGLKRPGDARAPSYDAQSALVVQRSDRQWWKAGQERSGFPGCKNSPPLSE